MFFLLKYKSQITILEIKKKFNMFKVACLVVTYFPNLDQINNIGKISILFDKVYVIDNSTSRDIKNKLNKNLPKNINIKFNRKNYGIGKSTNLFFKEVSNLKDFKWTMLLDQDSSFNFDPKKLFKILDKKNIKISGLNFTQNPINKKINFNLIEKRRIIQSGMMINKEIFKKIKFEEYLFLDMTDFSFCEKVKKAGYKIYQFDKIYIKHFVGNTQLNQFLFFKKSRSNHPPINCFLMSRNRILLWKKNLYKSSIHKIILGQIKELALTLCFESNALRKNIARIKGVYSALRNKKFKNLNEVALYLNIKH